MVINDKICQEVSAAETDEAQWEEGQRRLAPLRSLKWHASSVHIKRDWILVVEDEMMTFSLGHKTAELGIVSSCLTQVSASLKKCCSFTLES